GAHGVDRGVDRSGDVDAVVHGSPPRSKAGGEHAGGRGDRGVLARGTFDGGHPRGVALDGLGQRGVDPGDLIVAGGDGGVMEHDERSGLRLGGRRRGGGGDQRRRRQRGGDAERGANARGFTGGGGATGVLSHDGCPFIGE